MRRKITTFVTIVLFALGIIYLFKYVRTAQSNVQKKNVLQTKTPITGMINLGDTIIIGTNGGKIIALSSEGNTLWQTKIDSSIFDISGDSKEGTIVIGGVNFYVFNKAGKQIFKKGFKNYIGVKGKCISSGNIELLYQSLTNLSYIAVTTDKTGKTLYEEKIPDLGESSQIDISSEGELLFAGERGELYLIDKDGVKAHTVLPVSTSNLHSIYAYFVDNKIVAGFRLNAEKNPVIPVFFYSKDLKTVSKVLLHNNVNNILLEGNDIVFATENKFITFNEDGKEISSMEKIGFSPFSFSSSSNNKLYLYMKSSNSTGQNKKNIYYVSVIKNNTEIVKYVFSSGFTPAASMGKESTIIFIADNNKLILVHPVGAEK